MVGKSKKSIRSKRARRKVLKGVILKDVLIFLLKFNLLALPLYALMYSNFSLPQLQFFLTDVLYSLLKALGYEIAKDGFMLGLLSGSTIATIKIDMDCTGWKSMYALAALIIATPAIATPATGSSAVGGYKKLKFLALGLASLFLINIARLLTTIAFVYHFGLQHLDLVHTMLWREGLILAVAAIWYLWLRKVEKLKKLRK